MTINENQYCQVDKSGADTVTQGPRKLRQNEQDLAGKWWDNVWTVEVWPDSRLETDIQFWPYRLIDDGPPQDGKSYNRSIGDFVITPTEVTQTAIYTEWTQKQYDLNADTTLTDSQRVAADLAAQTERLIDQDDKRLLAAKDPLIPPTDRVDVETYLGTLYDAMDDSNIPPTEPPGATRQLTAVPGENRDRAVIRREHVEFGGFNYYEIQYTLYTDKDATGMSLWVERQDGTYLFTLPLVDQGDGVWYVTTDKNGGMANNDNYRVALFKGEKISQDFDLPVWDDPSYPLYLDVRWLDELLPTIIDGGVI